MEFRRVFRPAPGSTRDLEAELRDEIDSHIQICADALQRKGLSRDAALAAARARFGDLEESMRVLQRSARERSTRVRRRELLHAIRQDLAFAWRHACRAPGFSAAVMLTLALGIGANATMFGVVDRLLISPPSGIDRADEIRRLYWSQTFSWAGLITQAATSYERYASLRDDSRSWTELAAQFPGEAVFGRGEHARPIRRNLVTASYWSLLRPRLHIGRFFTEHEDAAGKSAAVAVLSYDFWRSTFGGDTSILGKPIVVADKDFTVVGVAAPDFTGTDLQRTDVWVSMSAAAPAVIGDEWQAGGVTWLGVLGRLRPGMTDSQAAAEATLVFRRALVEADESKTATLATVDPTARAAVASVIEARGPAGRLVRTAKIAQWLSIMSVLVLIIATANVASLMLARASTRQREVAVRTALGASRSRLAALLLTESALHALAGGIAGLLLGAIGSRAAQQLLLPDVDWSTAILGQNVLLLSAMSLFLIAVLTSIAPIAVAGRADMVSALKSAGRGATLGKSRARSALILTQAALSVLLLCGAGLFVRSLHRAVTTDLGFDAERVIITRLNFSSSPGDAERDAQALRLVTMMKARPDVAEAALGTTIPFYSSMSRGISIPGRDSLPHSKDGGPYFVEVTPDYFRTMGTAIVRGRGFTEQDRAGTPLVAILNETMARTFFGGEDALGRCIQVGQAPAPCTRVVGIARDSRRQALDQREPVFQYYVPLAQRTVRGFRPVVFVRAKGEVSPVVAALRQASAALSPEVSYAKIDLLQQLIDPQIRPWRLGAGMFAAFGLLALLIAGVGLYSVLAYEVNRRRPEFGIRMALGASGDHIVRLVLQHGTALTLGGLVLGLAGAAAGAKFVAPLLYQTSPSEPAVYGVVVGILLLTAVIASVAPALRARRVDPNSVLKDD